MGWLSAAPILRTLASAGVGCAAALMLSGCQSSDPAATQAAPVESATPAPAASNCGTTSELPATYRTKGKELVGDMDGDGTADEVTLRVDPERPERCRHVLAVELAGGGLSAAPVEPLEWPGTNPKLLLLADIDDQPGLEAAIAMSPANVYRPGAVFTLRDGELARTRVERLAVPELVPFYDEFPMGVDCAGEPGSIVVTIGGLKDAGVDDSHWDVTRSFYRAADTTFEFVRKQEFRVEVGPEAPRRWPEVRGRPFLSCENRVT